MFPQISLITQLPLESRPTALFASSISSSIIPGPQIFLSDAETNTSPLIPLCKLVTDGGHQRCSREDRPMLNQEYSRAANFPAARRIPKSCQQIAHEDRKLYVSVCLSGVTASSKIAAASFVGHLGRCCSTRTVRVRRACPAANSFKATANTGLRRRLSGLQEQVGCQVGKT